MCPYILDPGFLNHDFDLHEANYLFYFLQPPIVLNLDEISFWLHLATIFSYSRFLFNFNCLLMLHSVYHISPFLKCKIGAYYCICSLVKQLPPELCFWSAKTRNFLNFLLIHLSQGPGAQMLFRHKWWKPARLLWFLLCVSDFKGMVGCH